MVLAFLRQLVAPAPVAKPLPPATYNPSPDYDAVVLAIPRYPPFDQGLPFVPVAHVLDTQRDYVARIRDLKIVGATEAIERLVAYVHLLPASTQAAFCGAGGLFRLCLETGFHSYISAQGAIFAADEPTHLRAAAEDRWRTAAFYAGLCCELGRAVTNAVVTNDRDQIWAPFLPITTWLQDTRSTRYYLRPPRNIKAGADHSALSGTIVQAVIPQSVLNYLSSESDRAVITTLFNTIGRLNDGFNGSSPLARLVRPIRDQVIERDSRQNPMTFGTPLVGTHLEPYLMGAMRDLVANGTWKCNEKMARVHLAPDGCFIFWKTGLPELLDLLRTGGVSGVVAEERTLAELLVADGVFTPGPDGSPWHYVRTPFSSTVHRVTKLSSPGMLFADETLPTISIYDAPITVPATEYASGSEGGSSSGLEPSSSPVSASQLLGMVGARGSAASAAKSSSAGPASAPSAQAAKAKPKKSAGKVPAASAPHPDAGVQAHVDEVPDDGRFPDDMPPSDADVEDVPFVNDASAEPADAYEQSQSDAASKDAIAEVFTSPLQARALRDIRDGFNSGTHPEVFRVDEGVAIELALIARLTEQVPFLTTLASVSAIFVAPGETRRIYMRKNGAGVEVRVCILLAAAAQRLGFSV